MFWVKLFGNFYLRYKYYLFSGIFWTFLLGDYFLGATFLKSNFTEGHFFRYNFLRIRYHIDIELDLLYIINITAS